MSHIIMVGLSQDEAAVYAVIRSETFKKWERGEAQTKFADMFAMFYGGSKKVDTFDSWVAASNHVVECGGTVDNVIPCQAY